VVLGPLLLKRVTAAVVDDGDVDAVVHGSCGGGVGIATCDVAVLLIPMLLLMLLLLMLLLVRLLLQLVLLQTRILLAPP
jgi:hypothetical protein